MNEATAAKTSCRSVIQIGEYVAEQTILRASLKALRPLSGRMKYAQNLDRVSFYSLRHDVRQTSDNEF